MTTQRGGRKTSQYLSISTSCEQSYPSFSRKTQRNGNRTVTQIIERTIKVLTNWTPWRPGRTSVVVSRTFEGLFLSPPSEEENHKDPSVSPLIVRKSPPSLLWLNEHQTMEGLYRDTLSSLTPVLPRLVVSNPRRVTNLFVHVCFLIYFWKQSVKLNEGEHLLSKTW